MVRYKGIMFGALTGSLLASALTFLGSREKSLRAFKSQTQDWANKAKNIRENVYDIRSLAESRTSRLRKTFASGAALGLLMGAGLVALLTPKSGRQLRKDLSQGYQGVADKTTEIIHYFNQNGHRKPIKKFVKALEKRKRTSLHRK